MTDPTRIDIEVDPLTKRMKGIAVHGDTPFDVPYISHIAGHLYTGGCQDGLVLPTNIAHLLSLYPWEEYTITHELRSLTQVKAYDAEPDKHMMKGLADWATICLEDGPTLIHCQAGLNRSGLVAALVLMNLGYDADRAIALLREKRSDAVLCNPHFVRWLRDR